MHNSRTVEYPRISIVFFYLRYKIGCLVKKLVAEFQLGPE